MSRLPRLTGDELIRILERRGFRLVRTRGAHHVLRDAQNRTVVVPVHSGESLGPGILTSLLRSAGISRDELDRLRS